VEKQVLRHASLVRRDHVGEAEDVSHGIAEVEEVSASRIRLVANHQPGPLAIAHRRGSAVGQEIYVDAVGGNRKDVHAGITDQSLPIFTGNASQRLYDLDSEWFGGQSHDVAMRFGTQRISWHGSRSLAVRRRGHKNAATPVKPPIPLRPSRRSSTASGGTHDIGDNDANDLLAYGEGSATHHCAKVREWRASRLDLAGQP